MQGDRRNFIKVGITVRLDVSRKSRRGARLDSPSRRTLLHEDTVIASTGAHIAFRTRQHMEAYLSGSGLAVRGGWRG